MKRQSARSTANRSLFSEIGALECLSRYWPPYAAFVNGPRPEGTLRSDWVSHRRALEAALGGRWLLRGHGVEVPLLLVGDSAGVHWALDGPQLGQHTRADYRFALMLLGLPAARWLLRRCDRCAAFFLGGRGGHRKQSFCSGICRAAFNRARRDKTTAAAYMRNYRRLQADRRREQKQAQLRAHQSRTATTLRSGSTTARRSSTGTSATLPSVGTCAVGASASAGRPSSHSQR